LTDLLIAEASPLMRNLRKTLPSGEFGTYIDIDGPEDMIVFYSMNMNESDMDLFKKTVDESLAEIAEKGFSDELVDSIKSSLELSTKLTGESTDIGVDLITTIASYYASTGQHFGYLDYVEGLDRIDEWNAQGLYTKAISEWLLNADVNVLTLTFPKPGLREALDAQEAERLAAVKASMSEAELQAIIDMTNASDEEDDAAKYVKQLQAVTVGSLPEELKTYEVSDEKGKDGVRYIDARADVDGVGSVVILLDASALPQEDIHWFNLYMALVGEMDTASHDDDEISLLISRYLYNGDIRLSIAEEDNEMGYTPRLRAGWIATDEDMAKAYDLMYELLYESDFSDYELMEGLVSQMRASLKSAANQEPYNLMIYRSFGASDPLYRYYSYISGIEYYDFLGKVDEMLLSDPAPVKAKLESVQDYFRDRDKAAVLFAGNEESSKVNRPLAEAFMAKLDSKPREAVAYSFEEPAQREALIVNSNVQFNGITADYETLGLDYYSGDLDALSSFVSDAFLYPMLRDQYGAYSVMAGFTEDHGAYIVSYRDPNVAETFDVYADLPDFLEETDITQEELDGYILSSYSYYAKGSGELSGAISAAVDALCGTSQEDVLDYMKELKAMTPEKLRKYADLYRKLVENGMMFTA
ncbi:MAG: hypothetical protein II689_02320, partial [Firmicutes bacterium]|nr:hypothetical protein [Bacillota bacterium]